MHDIVLNEATHASINALIRKKVKVLIPMTAIYLISFVGLTLLADFAKGVVGMRVIGSVNLGFSLIAFNYLLSWDANWLKQGKADGNTEVRIARLSAVAIGLLAILLDILAQGMNVAVLVILAICIAASANLPVLILSLFWRRFNTGGVIGGMSAGLISAVALAMLGPAMRGADAIWPLVNPTIASLPIGFVGAVFGTLIGGRDPASERRFGTFLISVHTGVNPS